MYIISEENRDYIVRLIYCPLRYTTSGHEPVLNAARGQLFKRKTFSTLTEQGLSPDHVVSAKEGVLRVCQSKMALVFHWPARTRSWSYLRILRMLPPGTTTDGSST
jgi:hypothetical protein